MLAGLEVTTKAVERHAEAIGADVAARDEQQIRSAKQLDLPIPFGTPIRIMYLEMDGTGLPVVASETEGRAGKIEGQPARTRECKGHGPNLRLTFKISGKTVTESLPDQPATRKAEREIAEFRKLQDLHKELIEVNAQICQLRPSEPDVLSPEEKKRRKRSKRKSHAK
jgi:hypothetical protein